MAFKLQMNWQTSLLSKKRKTRPPIGLRNIGNSCYLNSVLQCLTYTPPLANFCLNHLHTIHCDIALEGRKHDCPFCIVERRIARSLSIDLASDTPSKINNCLKIFAEHFRCGGQEDAHEFLRFVIDACHDTCLRLKKLARKRGELLNGNTVVKEIFGGSLQSQVKCLSCGNESNKVDDFMDISLEVMHSDSVKDALHKFFLPEILDGGNKYKCENCMKLVSAKKQLSILQAPNVLVIQLKRFDGILGRKIDKNIAFEERLVLSSYMCKAAKDLHPDYKLFGTIVHSGSKPESGHYYAYIKDAMGRWYCCNDAFVTLSSLQEVLSEKVYILFFSRTTQSPLLTSAGFKTIGTKSCNSNSNGNGIIKKQKTYNTVKEACLKPFDEDSLEKVNSTLPKVDRVQMKFSLGTSGSKRVSATTDTKPNMVKDHGLMKKRQLEDSNHLKANGVNETLSVPPMHKNCLDSDKRNNINDDSNKQPYSSANDKDMILNPGVDHIKSPLTDARISNSQGSVLSGEKRKGRDEDNNPMLSQSPDACAKRVEFQNKLEMEASSYLRSCGWLDDVYGFMRARNKLHVGGESYMLTDTRAKMIAEAKSKFLSKVPHSLSGELVNKMKSFSGMHQDMDP